MFFNNFEKTDLMKNNKWLMNYVFYPIVHACIFGANLSPDIVIWFLIHHIMSPIICLLLLVEPNVKTKQDYDNSKTNIKIFLDRNHQ